MHLKGFATILLCVLTVPVSASPFALIHRQAALPLPVTKIFQFPLGGYVEGLSFRSNGKLLGNLLAPEPSIYQFDVEEGCAKKVTTIPNITGLYGIAEAGQDQFYVAGGRFNLTASTREIGSYAVWHVNLTCFDDGLEPEVTKISDFPRATVNGMWTLDAAAGLILATDSTNGVIYRLDVNTGENEITIDDPVLKIPANGTVSLGVNGIEVRDGYLYFTNTGAGTFGRIPMDSQGVQTGPGEVLAQNPEGMPGGDDWTFDANGNAFVAENPSNWVSLIRAGSSTPEIIAGGPNSTDLLSPTVAKFGVSAKDVARGSLYVGNSGGLAQYRSGHFTVGGGLYRIDTAVLGLSA